ncbi:MAG TPA: hypothetical protein VG738_08825 [Chitinophagaceae bacterium]|nr:hypothetical protein [Chitinophagaceae bacterium]
MITYVRLFAAITAMPALLFTHQAKAQTDPKLHPGEAVKVTKVSFTGKGVDAAGDSTVNVKIEYLQPDGSTAMLNMRNVKYAKTDSAKLGHVLLEDGTRQDVPGNDVKSFAENVIQNPPDKLYFVDGIETARDKIKQLDIKTITTVNIVNGDEAVAKYGAKARKGVILFTTK